MDLLRVVLAQQPLTKLITLPRLLASPSFVAARKLVLHQSVNRAEDYVLTCVRGGELFQGAEQIVRLRNYLLRERAIFLRNWEIYRHFWSVDADSETGFWYAIASDIPQIQALAIQLLLVAANTGSRDVYMVIMEVEQFQDLLEVKWTEELRQALVPLINLVANQNQPSFRALFLLGFLNFPFPQRGIHSEPYIAGKLTWVTGGNTILTQNNICDTILAEFPGPPGEYVGPLIESGYLFPLFERMKRRISQEFKEKFVSTSVLHFNLETLRVCISKGWTNIRGFYFSNAWQVSRRDVVKIRDILNDASIVRNLPQDWILGYRLMIGEIVPEPLSLHERVIVGNPGPTTQMTSNVWISNRSIVLYDPVFSLKQLKGEYKRTAAAICYRRGLAPESD